MIKRPLFILTLFALILPFSYVAAADRTPQQLVEEARSEVKSVSIHDVKRMIDRNDDVIILDVRDKKEFEKGHIPGAIHISRGLLEFMVEKKIPDKDAKIVVYWIFENRSPLATRRLNELGYKNAILMKEGFSEWKKASYSVESGSSWFPF